MPNLATDFAPAERDPLDFVNTQSRYFSDSVVLRQWMDLVPDMIMILNSYRQVVFANRAVCDVTRAPAMESVLGQRPGEVFHCKHCDETEGGCGTTLFCRYCGAVNSILEAQSGRASVQECRMTIAGAQGEESLDLRVWATPILMGNEKFTFFVIANIADEKRRQQLERIFLHDIMNTASALRGFSGLLQDEEDASCRGEYVTLLSWLAERIVEEIESQRQLIAAENGELTVTLATIDSLLLLQEVCAAYGRREALNGRLLRIAADAESIRFRSDRALLFRVLGNMLKNGIEGSAPAELISIGCRRDQEGVAFSVHNPTYIPENIRLQIFNRSFSTKGVGRGLGTYSMRFLSEKYLGGRISFESSESEGTTFTAVYPLNL